MPLSIPTRTGVTTNLQNYVRDAIPNLDPSTGRRSFIGGLVKTVASGLADWYIALKRYADREPFPQTATESFLTAGWWLAITHQTRNPPTASHGYVAIIGTPGARIPAGTAITGSAVAYTTTDDVSIVTQTFTAVSLTADFRTGLATFTTASEHRLATGLVVTITGAAQAPFNGVVLITVTGPTTFTYAPLTIPGLATATGPVVATINCASSYVVATTTGQSTNVDPGTQLTINGSLPTGVNATAYVTAGGLNGGADLESVEEFRTRILEALGTDFGMFTADEIVLIAKSVPGVTRVMVRKATFGGTNGVLEGQVKIAFLRDDDANPLPSAQEVADVRNQILTLSAPAHTAPEDIIVMSPPPYTVNFQFSGIVPDTPGMRLSIAENLSQFFRESAQWGEVITQDSYRCAILAAYDAETRQRLKSFGLIAPSGNVTPGTDDMPVLGQVTF